MTNIPSPHINNSDAIEYFVVHSEPNESGTCEFVSLLELDPSNGLASGQPYIEQFASYDEALERAIELGYEPPVPVEGDEDDTGNLPSYEGS